MRLSSLAARAVAATLAMSALLAGASARATVVVQLTRAQHACQSSLVVRASVADQRSLWNEDHSQIITLTRLRVTQYVRGTGPTELIVRQFGGRVGDLVSEVPGDGALLQGQDVVLFLRAGSGVVYLTALAQSVYLVVHSPGQPEMVRRTLHDLSFATQANGRMTIVAPASEPDETLDHLIADVRGIAACTP